MVGDCHAYTRIFLGNHGSINADSARGRVDLRPWNEEAGSMIKRIIDWAIAKLDRCRKCGEPEWGMSDNRACKR